MYTTVLVAALLSTTEPHNDELEKLYTTEREISYDDLVVDVRGYKVPTKAAFQGWVLLNNAEKKVEKIGNQLREAGIKETMPLHLILLQGTDWVLSDTTLFSLPEAQNMPKMIKTLKFIQTYIEPEIGVVIPVSGERTSSYNQQAGGAPRSKHLEFCALDMVPSEEITREELHVKLKKIHSQYGKEHFVGLGLYDGVRFHIDTCGYRQW